MKLIILTTTMLFNLEAAIAMNLPNYGSMPMNAPMPQYGSMPMNAPMPQYGSMPMNAPVPQYGSMPMNAPMPQYGSMPMNAPMPTNNIINLDNQMITADDQMIGIDDNVNWSEILKTAIFEINKPEQVMQAFDDNMDWWKNYDNLEMVSEILSNRSNLPQINDSIFTILNQKLLEGAKQFKQNNN